VSQLAMLIGSSPYDSPFFKDHFKVVRRNIIQLTPGASHRHTVSLKPNRLVKEEDVNVNSSPLQPEGQIICTAGFQCFTLLFMRPYAAVDTTPASPPPATTVNTPRSLITFVQSNRYTYTQVVGLNQTLTYTTGLPTPGTPTFTTVNPLTGVVNVPVTAP